jgi:cell division protein FtsN
MAKKSPQQATRGSNGRDAVPAWIWILTGVVLGLALSAVAYYKDWMPREAGPQPNPTATAAKSGEGEVAPAGNGGADSKPKYDFYSVLPEMEVVIPEAEVTAEAAKPEAPASAETAGMRYLLQTGSFRAVDDAEQMKAQLALLGLRAAVVAVKINDTPWHRVRVGPYGTARELDEARRTLEAAGIESIALKEDSR